MKIITAIKDFCRPPQAIEPGARIVYWRSADRDWRWHLVAANNEIMAQGEGYTSKQGVLRGIGTVRAAMSAAEVSARD